ncbi:thermonuclease family protein [Caulobacter sp. 17J80-11]|uniref:thermonuclease family protein n=1 Tax=Caulobacter sp. 17J80-11 TaxID=2763502 RepID=UPI001653931C|nr:thermonuclease family protein [Caulobacter sp. 17J80-11]MBC6982906.1 thermonuclease family protein [Caulobacter sp. 17J80-11]
MHHASAVGLAALLSLVACGVASADPCTAKLPSAGAIVQGEVRYIGDGDSLCIGRTADPGEWVEIRLADFNAPELNESGGREAKAALASLVMGRQAICRVEHHSYDRAVAMCSVDGRSIGDQMRRYGVAEGGR